MVELVQPEASESSSWDFLVIRGGPMRVIWSLPEDALVEVSAGEGVSLEEELALEEGFWDFFEVEGETREAEVESDQ